MDGTRGEAVITAVASGQDMSSSIWTGDPNRAGAVLCREPIMRTDGQTDRSMRQAALPCFRCVHCLRCAALLHPRGPASTVRYRAAVPVHSRLLAQLFFWVLLALPCWLRG